MRAFDLLRMAIHNLWQRRVRTMFNLTGIVTGCVVLLMTVAGASGVRNAIHALFDSSDFARQTHLEEVTEALRADLYQPQSSLAILQNIDHQIDQSSWIVLGIAIAILLTSAVGIFNTLTMSVVERTPEFGIMKSIGARDSHVMKLMIVEGAIVGMVGALVAVVLSILLGAVGQSILKYYVESRMQTEIAGKLFQPELLPIVLIFPVSVSLCILASILPAWRAAKLDPVVAMRRM